MPRKKCVLALMIERIAERARTKPWHNIRRSLDALQVTKLFNVSFWEWEKIPRL
jgi:hypothetical protein